MGILARALVDHLKEVAWALLLIFLVLFSLFMIFGRLLGYNNLIWICLAFAVIVTALFAMIILGNLIFVVIAKVLKRFFSRDYPTNS